MWPLGLCENWCDITACTIGALVLATLYFLKKPKNFPPGPKGLPFVGYIPFLGEHAAETLRKMKYKYGPVMSIRIGREDWVVLNDYNSINEGLVKQGEKFSGRPSNFMLDLSTERSGLVFVDYGSQWKTLRKFGLMTLRGFGVGKKGMEENIIEETPYLIESLMRKDGESCTIKLTKAVSNIICRVAFGQRFSNDDKKFIALIDILRNFFSESFDSKMFGIMTGAPVLRHFPVFHGAFKRIMIELDNFMNIFREILKEHKSSFDESDIRDFIDAFLNEMKSNKDPVSFNDRQLIQYIRDLFEAGTGTTSTTLTWAILAIIHYPKCQDKIFQEIEEVIGNGVPTMKHKEKMPYTSAFIQEIMRHRTLVPNGVIHKTNEKSTLQGFTIPRDTPVIPNIWSVHFDPEIFESPSEFRPERFINKNGEFVKSKYVIPFSVGPRHCLGEQLARMEVFIFLTGIIQKLQIVEDPNHPPPPLDSGTYNFLLTLEPPDFKVKFQSR